MFESPEIKLLLPTKMPYIQRVHAATRVGKPKGQCPHNIYILLLLPMANLSLLGGYSKWLFLKISSLYCECIICTLQLHYNIICQSVIQYVIHYIWTTSNNVQLFKHLKYHIRKGFCSMALRPELTRKLEEYFSPEAKTWVNSKGHLMHPFLFTNYSFQTDSSFLFQTL